MLNYTIHSKLLKRLTSLVPLRNRSDFLRLSAHGQKVVTKGAVVLIAPTQHIEDTKDTTSCIGLTARIGFTVGKKVGNAVVRNRVKRRLRAVVREVVANHGKAGYDYVLIGRQTTIDREYVALCKDIRYALHKVDCFI